jgi:PPOX class probable F420-dependent enzyme
MNAETRLDPAARIDRLLASEPIVWLSTVRPDGTPHLVPIWFSWDGERLFVASKPEARKVRNLRQNPKVMLALGEPDEDFDVGLVEAEAELPTATTAELLPAGHFEKYRDRMAMIGLDEATYVRDYSQPILIKPTRFLPWQGRSGTAAVVPPVAAVAAQAGGGQAGRTATGIGPAPLRLAVERLLAPLGLRRAVPDTSPAGA